METKLWQITRGEGPLLATSIHSGHELRPELASLCALDEATQLREEDPYTDFLTTVAPNRVVPHRSRFEVDLNRSRDQAVYRRPEDAWGLQVWKQDLTEETAQRSLAYYDSFYQELEKILSELNTRYSKFVVFDLHSYNHRRGGPDAAPEEPAKNPEINVGTGTMNRTYWAPLVDRFISELRDYNFLGRHLDVRENVKFRGRQLAQWTHENFPTSGCCLALEFKKFWMDEWTGEPDQAQLEALHAALLQTVPGILEELGCNETNKS